LSAIKIKNAEKFVTFSRILKWVFVGLLGTTAVFMLLILSGVFDPKPNGVLVAERPLFPQIVAPQAPRITWLEESVPAGNYSVRLTAAQETGEKGRGMDVGYGLVLGNDDTHVAVSVSPLGYLSVWQVQAQELEAIMPWQTWPHVGRDLAANEIWVDVAEGNQVTVRINREFLWQGEIEPLSGQVGVIAESFGETAVVDFQKLEIFAEVP
jgi:hypothetical protein